MRVFAVPARYGAELEAAVSRAVDLIRNDMYRRATGEPPVVPDFMIHEERTGHVFVVLGKANDELADAVTMAAKLPREPRTRSRKRA